MTAETDDEDFTAILDHLKSSRGFDFTGYKTASVRRRIGKRLEATESETYSDYLDYLLVHPDEFEVLFNTILINVTAFFRDPDAWEAFTEDVVPRLLAARSSTDPIRIWCAGCASGEEAYTLAIVLCEALGERAFRERVKIYGTDVDEEALDEARQAVYSARQIEGVSEELRARYFTRVDQRFAFRKDLRRALIFGRNDLVQDAPISRVDLLTCRNTLMYFNAETQSRILKRFHFALRPDGHLFLGKSEMLLTRGELFRPVNLRRRIFSPVATSSSSSERILPTPTDPPIRGDAQAVLAAFEASPVAQLVIDRDRTLASVNEAARTLLDVATTDLGRPLQDLRVSYRPAELRAGLDALFAEGRGVDVGPVAIDDRGETRTIEVRLLPIRASDEVIAAVVHFIDVTPQRQLEDELERHKTELSAAYEELQSTIEELETTNEELQSTNEELETTNEELQSTNEELETMNEELQSSNEELETTNDELRSRSLQLNEANSFMDTILTSMGVGVIVVDHEQRVRIWNAQSEDLWGVRREEAVGEHVLGLDIGLPLDLVRAPLREALYAGDRPGEFAIDAVDRRGRTFVCAITIVPLTVDDADSSAAIILARRARDGTPVGPVDGLVGPV